MKVSQDQQPCAANLGSSGCLCSSWQRLCTLRMAFLLLVVDVVSASLPELYVEKVLEFLAASFEVSRHLEFYLIWTQKLLMSHGQRLKPRYRIGSHLLFAFWSSHLAVWSWQQESFPAHTH